MGTIRKLERQAVRAKMSKEEIGHKSFKDIWQEFRNKKYVTKDENGNVLMDSTPRNTQRKKQVHFDDKQQYVKLFAFADKLEANRKKTITEQSSAEDD